jgi:hypothetical protein
MFEGILTATPLNVSERSRTITDDHGRMVKGIAEI